MNKFKVFPKIIEVSYVKDEIWRTTNLTLGHVTSGGETCRFFHAFFFNNCDLLEGYDLKRLSKIYLIQLVSSFFCYNVKKSIFKDLNEVEKN